ncbi:MAG: FAD-binding protein [Nitratireductor sp.]|nr:FAD-binding protein [Nitratireductor sp.]
MSANSIKDGAATASGWDREVDVVVVGYGAAGAVAASEAASLGARTLLLEKMPFPGGLSIASAGGIRVTSDSAAAFEYLKVTCGGRTPEKLLKLLADEMASIGDYVKLLADEIGATTKIIPALGNYPLPGYEALAYCEVLEVPDLEGLDGYHAMAPVKNGVRLFRVLEAHVERTGVEVRMQAPVRRLLRDASGSIIGVLAEIDEREVRIRALGGVILACGGFEADREMQRQYFQADPVMTGAFLGNTGDGIRMAQAAGADLWHMWHYHGPYGLQHSDPAYPFGLFLKAVPMWTPGRLDEVSSLGVDQPAETKPRKSLARLAWIVVDQDGRRFMNEYPPYPGDSGVRPFDSYDFLKQKFPRNPAFMIFDEEGRKMYPLGRAVHNDHHPRHEWSADNLQEVEMGIFERADTLEELADLMCVSAEELAKTVSDWNDAVAAGNDTAFHRVPETMMPIGTPPFYFGRVGPVVINTQGGPVHDERQRVLTPFGEPIEGLFAAGELGSVFGHLYMSGGNLAECLIGGRIAGRETAAASRDAKRGADRALSEAGA